MANPSSTNPPLQSIADCERDCREVVIRFDRAFPEERAVIDAYLRLPRARKQEWARRIMLRGFAAEQSGSAKSARSSSAS